MNEAVEVESREGVAMIALNRPEKLNAINDAVLAGLRAAIAHIERDPAIGAAVLHGRGRAFSAGGDIAAMSAMDEAAFARTIGRYMEVAKDFRGSSKPIVAAIHGHALAGGFELACLCDIRIAAEDARFGLPDAPLGLSPTSGMTHLLPRIVGLGRALDLALAAEPIDAREAQRIGLVTRVVDRAALLDAAHALAARIASFPRIGVARSKRGFYGALETAFAEATAAEHESELACFRDPVARERLRAFVDRKRD
ncbi:MAG: enoyl-CoA hydratase/isomerase family protein [Alphaproteobacteria bacterium]|nr:enoyl-CoA hydratase/isomerase family protein [Alphaproteobacteria bacterium]